MREVTLPDTSLSAFRSLTPEKLAKDYSDIIRALKALGEANYDQLATFLNWRDFNKCSRRTSELERAGIIYKPGNKTLTSRNRSAYTYKLVQNNEISAEPEKVMQGETICDISRKLTQKSLFGE